MCAPVIAGAIAAAGALTQGVQGMMAATYESRVASRNAQMEVDRARDSMERGRLEARDFYRNVGALKGQQDASMAANGVDIGFGTARLVREDTANLAREDAENMYKNQAERTRGFEINASNYRAEAAAARQRGRAALFNSIIQAGSSVAGGLQQDAAIRAAKNPSLMGGFMQQRGMRTKLGLG